MVLLEQFPRGVYFHKNIRPPPYENHVWAEGGGGLFTVLGKINIFMDKSIKKDEKTLTFKSSFISQIFINLFLKIYIPALSIKLQYSYLKSFAGFLRN